MPELDLAWRTDQPLQYRLDMLKDRLVEYFNSGYDDLTLALDNVP